MATGTAAKQRKQRVTRGQTGANPPAPMLSPASLLATGSGKSAKPKQGPATQAQQVEAVRLVGERLRIARELNGLPLAEASKRFGFSSESGANLSKLETAKHVSAIPLWVIREAAKIYEVSADFLLGVTDDLRMVPRVQLTSDVSAWLFDAMERGRARDMEVLASLQHQVVMVFECERATSLTVQEFEAAWARWLELNPGFEGMRGGATVAKRLEELQAAAARTAAQLTKFRQMMRAAKQVPPVDEQLTLGLGR